MVVGGWEQSELGENRADVRLHSLRGEEEPFADRALFSPPSEQACDDLGINRRAATPYAVNGVYEIRHVRNPVLEQVTDRLRRLLGELRRVPRLDVLREYEHAHFGVFSRRIRCAAGSPSFVPVGGIRMSVTTTFGGSRPTSSSGAPLKY